jgi:hypothetical protein
MRCKLPLLCVLYAQDGIDLSILLGTLVPPDMLVEEDTLWTFDSLLRVRVLVIILIIVYPLCIAHCLFSSSVLQEVTEELNTAKSAGPVKKQ